MAVNRYDMSYTASSAPYVIWGTIYPVGGGNAQEKDYAALFATRNLSTSNCSISSLYGLTSTPISAISDHNWNSPGQFNFTITTTCAWYVYLQNTIGFNFFLVPGSTFGNVTLEGTTGGIYTATYGGNGQVQVYRDTNVHPGATAVMHIYFSTEGGSSSNSWLCTSSF